MNTGGNGEDKRDPYLRQAIGARRFTPGCTVVPGAGVPETAGDMDMEEETTFGEGVSS